MEHSLWFRRTLNNINLEDKCARFFVDMADGNRDEEAKKLLEVYYLLEYHLTA